MLSFPSWKSPTRKPEPLRIDVTLEGLECLECIFESCVTSVMQNPPSVNLRTFLDAVGKSKLLTDTLGQGRGLSICLEIHRLDNSGAHNQFVNWQKLRSLLESLTLLNFPITNEAIAQLSDYQLLLHKNGIATKPSKDSESNRENAEDSFPLESVSERYGELSSELEKQHNAANNYGNGENSPISDRVDNLMHGGLSEEAKEKLVRMRFVVLTAAEYSSVQDVFDGPSTDDTVIEKFNIPMTSNKLNCLKPSAWLNDEVSDEERVSE